MAPSKRFLRHILKPETINSRWRLPKPDVPVSQLLYKIAKKFQLLSACFGGRKLNGAIGELHLETGSPEFKIAAVISEVLNLIFYTR
jgi:hypothetical protein